MKKKRDTEVPEMFIDEDNQLHIADKDGEVIVGQQAGNVEPPEESDVDGDPATGEKENLPPDEETDEIPPIKFDDEATGESDGGDDDKPGDNALPMYTPEELDREDFEKVDLRRLPPSLKAIYNRMRAGFGKKTEQIADLRKQLEGEIAESKRIREELERKARTVDPREEIPRTQQAEIVAQQIKAEACRLIGIPEEDFDPYNPTHMSFHQMATTKLFSEWQQKRAQAANELAQRETETLAAKKFESEMNSTLEEYKLKEPNFAEIQKWFTEWQETLPVKEFKKIEEIARTRDIKLIRKEILEKCRMDWYKTFKKSDKKINHEPPVREREDGHVDSAPPKKLDAEAFGNMSAEQQTQFLIDGGYVE